MRKIIYCLVVVTLIAGLITGCAEPAPTPAAPASTPKLTPISTPPSTPTSKPATLLKIQTYTPSGENEVWLSAVNWVKLVEERTKGAIKIDLKGDGGFVSEKEIHEAARTGIIDGYVGSPSHFSRVSKGLGDLLYLSYFVDPPVKREHVNNPPIFNMFDKYMDEAGIKLVVVWPVNTHNGWMLKKPAASIGPEMLKGFKIRSGPGSQLGVETEALGASTIDISLADMYMAIQLGTVDGMVGGVTSGGWAYKVYEVAPYIYDAGELPNQHAFWLSMNKGIFNKMPQELREAILQAGKDNLEPARSISAKLVDEKIIPVYKADPKIHYYALTDTEKAKLAKVMAPKVWSWLEKTSGKAHSDEIRAALEAAVRWK